MSPSSPDDSPGPRAGRDPPRRPGVEPERGPAFEAGLLHALVESSPDWIFAKDRAHRFLFVNEAFARAHGLEPAAMIGRPDTDFWPAEWFEDDPAGERLSLHHDDLRAFQGETVQRIRPSPVLSTGTVVTLDVLKRPLRNARGEIIGVLCYARDLTRSVRAEAALRESEERFRTLVGNIPGIVYRCECTPPYRDLYVSPGIEAVTGWRTEDYTTGRAPSFGSITLEGDRAAVENAVNTALQSHTPYQFRYRIRHRNGEIRWIEEQGRAAYDDAGAPRWLDGVIVDVTTAHRAEELARAAEERFRTLVANVPGVVFRCEVTFPYRDLFISQGVERLTGYPVDALLAPGGPCFGDLILEEDRPPVIAEADAAMREHRAFAVNYRLRHADGGIRWVEEQGVAYYGPDGTALWLDGVITDVTARREAELALRESEARFRAIVEHNPECVKVLDATGHLLDMNPAGLAMIEADSLDQVRGHAVSGLVAPADQPAFREMVSAVFRGETRRLAFEITGLRGTRRVMESTCVPLWADGDRRTVRALLGVTQDITDRRRLEGQLRQSQKMEALGTLAGGIAHDFNNILAAVIGHAELLRSLLPAEPEAQEHLTGILGAGQRARDLVQQILTFSRGREPERVLVRLADVLAEAVRLLRASLPTSIELRVTPPAPTLGILADPTQVQQVLLNLCSNAAQAMSGNRGRIEIEADVVSLTGANAAEHPKLPPGAYVRLSVADTGVGMSPELLERIFDPFFTTKDIGQGTGLGLAVVHGIMVANGGAVMVRSTPGQGSAFHLYFPLVPLPAEGGVTRPAPVAAATLPAGAGQHILVVDDEPQLVRIATRALERRGWRVTGATRPADALAAVRDAPGSFDLLLCDLTMPQMTGLELARAVHALRPDLPMLLMTGYAGSLDLAELQALGIRELVEKPFVAARLVEAVARHLPRTVEPLRT